MRYEAIEVDGKWFVMDHRNPNGMTERIDKADAEFSAAIWNSLVEGTYQAWVNER